MVKISAKLIFVIVLAISTISAEDRLVFEEIKHNAFTDNDSFGIQKLLMMINNFGFCLLPRQSHIGIEFMKSFYRYYNVDMDKLYSIINDTSSYLDRVYKRYETPRIPHKSHRVWVTDPTNPREMTNVLVDQTLQNYIFETNKVLERSGGTWEHFLWTNDPSLIPETVNFFESRGVKVRDMRELGVWNDKWQLIFDKQLTGGIEVGKAADNARMLILHDQGGLYMDLDCVITEWSNDFHYYFDFLSWAEKIFDLRILTNWSWMQRANHEVSGKYIDLYLHNYFLPMEEKPFNIQHCQAKTAGSVLYETGNYFFSLVYYMAQNQNNNQDIIVVNPSEFDRLSFDIKTEDGSTRTLAVSLFQGGQGSWTNDYHDILNFGWYDLL